MRNYLTRNRRDPRAVKTSFVNGPPTKYPRISTRRSQDSTDRNYNLRSTRNPSGDGGSSSRSSRSTRSSVSRSYHSADPAVQINDKEETLAAYSPVEQSYMQWSSPSFLVCVVCNLTPSCPPLFGCESSHIICSSCRSMGGSLLSCPRCGSSDLQHRLQVAEELLKTELDENKLVLCPYKAVGCNKITRTSQMGEHRARCLFRPVQCPKGLYSLSCSHIGPLYTIQQHARDEHNLHQGITILEQGLIASKMFDKSAESTCCDDTTNARFQPLELTHGENLFYCYFERVASRKLWLFFIRMFDREEQSRKFQAVIMVGHSALERNDYQKAGIRFTGPVVNYQMKTEAVRKHGMFLTVSDEYLKSCKVENVLFRIWFQVKEKH